MSPCACSLLCSLERRGSRQDHCAPAGDRPRVRGDAHRAGPHVGAAALDSGPRRRSGHPIARRHSNSRGLRHPVGNLDRHANGHANGHAGRGALTPCPTAPATRQSERRPGLSPGVVTPPASAQGGHDGEEQDAGEEHDHDQQQAETDTQDCGPAHVALTRERVREAVDPVADEPHGALLPPQPRPSRLATAESRRDSRRMI